MGISRQELHDALASRHGEALQARFEAAAVAICGLGGLGSNIAVCLARSGVGRLHLIDFDTVEPTNLNRQQYAVSQLGRPKALALRETLLAIAPYCEIRADNVRISQDNFASLLEDDSIICEAFDGAEQKAMLVNGILERFPEKYLVAASGMAGIGSANAIKTRRITEKFYLCGDGQSDVFAVPGLFAPRVMACAAHQAQTVLRILAGELDA